MARMVRSPKLGEEYTFRNFDRKTQKFVFNTYRFTGEVTESGRFVFYEVRKGYFMDCTLAGFSYMMRKKFVRKKTVDGKISERVDEILPIERLLLENGATANEARFAKVTQQTKTTAFCEKALSEFKKFSPELKADIKNKTGVDCNFLVKLFKAFPKLPEGKSKDNSWNTLMKHYIKVASHQNVAFINL